MPNIKNNTESILVVHSKLVLQPNFPDLFMVFLIILLGLFLFFLTKPSPYL